MKLKAGIKKFIRCFVMLTKEKEVVPISKPIDFNELLKGKVALITGGSSGIGLAIAQEFARNRCKVIIKMYIN